MNQTTTQPATCDQCGAILTGWPATYFVDDRALCGRCGLPETEPEESEVQP